MQVLFAPDSFKGTATAVEAAHALASGWRMARPGDDLVTLPLADGGEGTLDAIEAATPGARRHTVAGVTGPDRIPTDSVWLEIPGHTAVVELASSSGLPLMREPDPLGATTRGLGETISAALSAGARAVWIGLGGSASTDGGLGALRALGANVSTSDGSALQDGGGALSQLTGIDFTGLAVASTGFTLLTDVTSPLLGPRGAAAVFGPQKGASLAQVKQLEQSLSHFAQVLETTTNQPPVTVNSPGTGAAGGTAYGFAMAYRASIKSGAEQIAGITDLANKVASADIVISGEGAFDEQSVRGKLVGKVMEKAIRAKKTTAVVAGVLQADPGVDAISLTDIAGSPTAATSEPLVYLQEAGRLLAERLTH